MWFFSALVFALVSSLGSVFAKRIMRDTGEYVYLWASGVATLPLLLISILYFYKIPKVDDTFFMAIGLSIIIDVIAALAAYRAIRISDLSLVAPLAAFNPVFTTLISFFSLKEQISAQGVMGIVIVCIGAYFLEIKNKESYDLLRPIKILVNTRGVQLSLFAYLLWAITPTLQKIAITHSTPQVPPFTGFVGLLGITTVYSFIVFTKAKVKLKLIKNYIPFFVLIGLLGMVGTISAFTAFSLANLGYVTAVFKLSMVFTVLLGWIFFKEHNIKNRLLGTIIMLIGVYLIVNP